MKKIVLLILLLIPLFSFAKFEYNNSSIDWKDTNILKIELWWNYELRTSISDHWDTLQNLINKEWAVAWVNWAYFCPDDYSNCDGNSTVSYRVYDWNHQSTYGQDLWIRGLLWVDKDSNPLFILNNYGYVDWLNKNYNEDKFDDLEYALSNFPVLTHKWRNVIHKSKNIFDTRMETAWTKSFICSKLDNKTVLMWTVSDVDMEGLAWFVTNSLDCHYAINLDAGGSLWMIVEDETIHRHWRDIMDAFVIVDVSQKRKWESKYSDTLQNVYQTIQNRTEKNPSYPQTLLPKIEQIKQVVSNNPEYYYVFDQIEKFVLDI